MPKEHRLPKDKTQRRMSDWSVKLDTEKNRIVDMTRVALRHFEDLRQI